MQYMNASTWTAFKDLAVSKKLLMQYSETTDIYDVFLCEAGVFLWNFSLLKGSADAQDFETNHKPSANASLISIVQTTPFAANQVVFKGEGVFDTVPAGTEKNIDFKITYNALLNGGILQTKGEEMGDYFSAHVVDKDNILGYGAGAVLNTWIVKWYALIEDVHMDLTTPQAGNIPANLYLRIKYKSTGATDVKVLVNYRLNQAL